VRLLDWFRVQPCCLEAYPLAGEVDHRLSPQSPHDLEELIAARPAIFPAVAAGFHLLLVPADANAEIDAAAGQPV
jgi:hypothetical protein